MLVMEAPKTADAAIAFRPDSDSRSGLESIAGDWFLAQTKSGKEFQLVDKLWQLGIPSCVPAVERRSNQFGKIKIVKRPLFACYVPFAGDASARYEAVTTQLTIGRISKIVNRERFVKEIGAVKRAVDENPKLVLFHGFISGKLYRVRPGHPLVNVEGIAEINESRATLCLRVSVLGNSWVTEEIDPKFLELAE